MRGKLINFMCSLWAIRITPARAGKTDSRYHRPRRAEDHPRACGENSRCPRKTSALRGSPPRVRGKPSCLPDICVGNGITPARAGKTLLSSRHLCREQDHPRACGENMFPRCGVSASIGSPPRVRGKPQTIRIAVGYVRITPARAGKTCLSKSAGLMPRDHPRACGENTATPQQTGAARGSPPRVRGKRPARAAAPACSRITPARAGKTLGRFWRGAGDKDHPRACGENRGGHGQCRN